MNITIQSVIAILVLLAGLIMVIYLKFISKKKEEAISSLLLTTGLELINASFGKMDDKFFAYVTKTNVENNYFQLVTGFILVVAGIFLYYYTTQKMYILNINGYWDARIENHYKDLGLNSFDFKEKEIDFIRLVKKGISKSIATDIQEELDNKIKAYIRESRGKTRAYTGIAPIPFILRAGKYFEREKMEKYYEYDKLKQSYYQLVNSKSKWYSRKKNYPVLSMNSQLTVSPTPTDLLSEDIVLVVSITSNISDVQTTQFSFPKIHLSIPRPTDNAIQFKNQLNDYYTVVYHTILDSQQKYPNLKRIHFLYAGQSSLAFELGKLMDDRRFPQIISYQFVDQATPKYPWGLVINGPQSGTFVKK